MTRSIPTLRRSMSACPFLLAFVLASTNLQMAPEPASPQQIETLNTEKATELLIHLAKPTYPAVAKVNLVQGIVMLQIKVSSTGHVSEAHVLEGEPILAVAALNAVRKWLYRPYLSPDGPAPFITYVSVRFNLQPHHFREQLPTDADKYLEKQIRPPEVISRPPQDASLRSIEMRVLVGSKGEVVDATSADAETMETKLARKNLQHWKFRPARWGAIDVPWYLTVKVPISRIPVNEVAKSAMQ